MYGISDHAYAQALVQALKHETIDARITDSGEDDEWPHPTLLIEEQGRELIIQDDRGGLPWAYFHSAGNSEIIIVINGKKTGYNLGETLPTDTGMESVVDAVKEIL